MPSSSTRRYGAPTPVRAVPSPEGPTQPIPAHLVPRAPADADEDEPTTVSIRDIFAGGAPEPVEEDHPAGGPASRADEHEARARVDRFPHAERFGRQEGRREERRAEHRADRREDPRPVEDDLGRAEDQRRVAARPTHRTGAEHRHPTLEPVASEPDPARGPETDPDLAWERAWGRDPEPEPESRPRQESRRRGQGGDRPARGDRPVREDRPQRDHHPARDERPEGVEEDEDLDLAEPGLRTEETEGTAPRSGLRGLLFEISGGRINLGPSAAEIEDMERVHRIQRHLDRPLHVAFLCFKGGVGKTSTAAGVMLAMANNRADGVVVTDLNPDAGDLAERLLGERLSGIYDFAKSCRQVQRRGDLGRWVVTEGRLAVLPGDEDPSPEFSVSREDVDAAVATLERYYTVIGMDAGTGFAQPIMSGVLANADVAVVCASHSLTGARRAIDTLEWLRRHGHEDLADNAVIALADKDRTSGQLSKDRVVRWLSRHTRGLVVVPHDPHVADGRQVVFGALAPGTRRAYEEIAAMVTDLAP